MTVNLIKLILNSKPIGNLCPLMRCMQKLRKSVRDRTLVYIEHLSNLASRTTDRVVQRSRDVAKGETDGEKSNDRGERCERNWTLSPM